MRETQDAVTLAAPGRPGAGGQGWWDDGRVRGRLLVPVAALALVATACGDAARDSAPTGVDELTIPSPSLAPSDFVDRIDNPWLPLAPGNRWVYRALEGGERRTITVTVLDRTEEIQGVTATVVHDVVTDADGTVVEDTFDWYAQDTRGNVWYLGEDTTEHDGRTVSTEGSWRAGTDGAEAGLAMAAHPRVGDGYRQEYLEGTAEDRARVLALDASASVPYGEFDGLLETEDTTPLEPGVVEHKLYARGVGVVREETIAGGDEFVELVTFTQK